MGAQSAPSVSGIPGWASTSGARPTGGFLSNMFGGSSESSYTPAPPMETYPTPDDAENARSVENSYGSGNEAYTEGRQAHVLSAKDAKDESTQTRRPIGLDDLRWAEKRNAVVVNPDSGGNVEGTPATAELYEKAQLAINRSPIAALGYDPRHINLDVKSPKDMNIVGLYSPGSDQLWANAHYPDVVVHESVHRGLEKLRQAKDDDDKPIVPKELWSKLPDDEEYIVRYIMARHMGDPEKGGGPSNDKQRAEALYKFSAKSDNPKEDDVRAMTTYSKSRRDALEELNKIASRYLLSQKPGGPR